jgi:hypothetical protein
MSGGFRKGTQNSKLLRINSSNRISGTNSNFTVDLGSSLQQVSQVSVATVQFYNVFYNITANPSDSNQPETSPVTGSNNRIDYKTSLPSSGSIFLTPGYYSATDLVTELTSVFSIIAGEAVTFTFDSINNKYSVQTTAITLTIIDPANGQNDSPMEMLGFTYTNGVITITPTPLQAKFIPNMVHVSIAYLASSALSPMNSVDEKGLSSNILQPINVTSAWGELNLFECKVDELCELIYPRTRILNRIDIQLVDHEGRVLDLQSTELNIELRVWFNTFS